jgi:hypothetical protein
VDQAQEDVLRANEAVVQEARLFLCEHKNSTSPVCESFEHSTASICGRQLIKVYRCRYTPHPHRVIFRLLFSVIGFLAYRL